MPLHEVQTVMLHQCIGSNQFVKLFCSTHYRDYLTVKVLVDEAVLIIPTTDVMERVTLAAKKQAHNESRIGPSRLSFTQHFGFGTQTRVVFVDNL